MMLPRPVQNLQDMRRAVATPGVVITVLEHWQERLRGTTRTPTKVQQNGYWFMAPDTKGEIIRMWTDYPKASLLRFWPDGSVTFHPDEPRSWRLKFEVPA